LKEGMLLIFITLKKSTTSAGFEPMNLGSDGKHTNCYTTEATSMNLCIHIMLLETRLLYCRTSHCL
jgi:hypothetical protein